MTLIVELVFIYFRMSGSRWVITPSWLSGSVRSFCTVLLYNSCHLVLIASASVRSVPFLSFIVPIFVWDVPLVFVIFSIVFPILLFPSVSLHCSLKKPFFFFKIYFNWRRITLQYCGGFCHALTWISHQCTCVPLSWTPLPPPSHLIPLGCPRAPAVSALLHALSLHWSSVLHMVLYMFQCYFLKSFLFLLAVPWNSVFRWVYLSFSPLLFASLLFSAISQASSDNHFTILHFFFMGMVLITASCAVLGTIQCKVKWAVESVTTNKASGGDGITAELFQILKDDAVKVLHSICQQIWKFSSGHKTGNDQFSFQFQRRTMPKNVHTTAQLHHFTG